jgi:parallel beta-helix repeat protein
MAPGTYTGLFSTQASGSKGKPITLCGPKEAVIDGEALDGGYGFHLDGAKYWVLRGFTVTNAQKGVMADGTVGSVVEGLTVHHIGDEGIHLRDFSTDNTVRGNTIFDTGNRRKKFGEGIYIGTANSNWCTVSDCKEDHSDRNVIEDNHIYGTTAESVDIKEGTSKGVLRGNSFDGGALTKAGGDSWVDVKGNDWLIEGNEGKDSIEDGFQVHDVVDGWGKRNVFRDNVAAVNGPGFGFAIRSKGANVVGCSNTATHAKEGLSNVPCS